MSVQKEIVLVLGNTGAGKSTFLQWIAGNDSELIAQEVTENSGEFIIVDGNIRIGSSTVNSKTFFPELVVDQKRNSSFYDCPGFSDTRSSSFEIAITYFIKKIVDIASSVKLVFIVNHSSVRTGVDRQDFMKLLRHTSELVKNVDKFDKSIALVATKVDNMYIKKEKILVLVDNDTVIKGIADFLRETRKDLEERLLTTVNNMREQNFLKSSMKLIDILLFTESKKFPKIGLFRRPDEPGPLSEIQTMLDEKQHIEKILFFQLKYTAKSIEDFGHTISDKSKNDINNLAQEINKNISSNVINIAANLQNNFKSFVDNTQNKINSFVTSAIQVSAELLEAHMFGNRLEAADKAFSLLIKEISKLESPKELGTNIGRCFLALNIDQPDLSYISKQGKYFEFFQAVNNENLSFAATSWMRAFQDVKNSISLSREALKKENSIIAEKIKQRITANVDTIAKSIGTKFSRTAESLEIQRFSEEFYEGAETITTVLANRNSLNSPSKLTDSIKEIIKKLNINDMITTTATSSIEIDIKYLTYLQALNNLDKVIDTSVWTTTFESTAQNLMSKANWYNYLTGVYLKLSDYQFQAATNKFNVMNLDHWGQINKPQGLTINKSNFQKFFDKIALYTCYKCVSKNLEVDDIQQREINDIVSLTLKETFKTECQGAGKLVIKGDFIKFSDITTSDGKLKYSCDGKIRTIHIFGLNTIFIDANLESLESHLVIMAPKWEIHGSQRINLNGSPGGNLQKAGNGVRAGSSGENGRPGLPGNSAGSFFGIGKTFLNEHRLTITASGGAGGPGQDGGDGAEGIRGESARFRTCSESGDFARSRYRDNQYKCCSALCKAKNDFYKYQKSGSDGGNGGNGGNSGKGGQGGYEGIVDLKFVNEVPNVMIINNKGDFGHDGEVGRGGLGGLKGSTSIAYCTDTELYPHGSGLSKNFKELISEHFESSEDRTSSGRAGYSGLGSPETPKPAVALQNKAVIINEYKIYLRENTFGIRKIDLLKFSTDLDRV